MESVFYFVFSIQCPRPTYVHAFLQYQWKMFSVEIATGNPEMRNPKLEIQNLVKNFQKQQSDLSRELQDTLKASVDDIEKTLNQSVTSLDSSMQQTLQRSLDILGQNLTSIINQKVCLFTYLSLKNF